MLTKTTECAIRCLIYLGLHSGQAPLSPRYIAQALDLSPTYLAKVCNLLVRAQIVRSHRGVQGGIILSRDPKAITLLEIVEACQGKIVGDYCEDGHPLKDVCAFHESMLEVHEALLGILSRWTLDALIRKPEPVKSASGKVNCRMARLYRQDKKTR